VVAGFHYWLADELRVVDRYAKALMRGRIVGTGVAAVRCREELTRLAVAAGRDPRELPASMRERIGKRARLHGWVLPGSEWRIEENRVLDRYVRACVRGEYPSIESAARECWKEMRGARGSFGRKLSAVRLRLLEAARAQGRQPYRRWTKDELRVAARHVSLLYEGRYRCVRQAADGCARELRQRHVSLQVAYPPRPAAAIYQRLTNLAPTYRLPRRKGEMTADEKKVVERYARALARGEFGDARVASAACLTRLRESYGRVHRVGSVSVRGVTGHSVHAVRHEMLKCLQRLKLFVLSGRSWSDEEDRLCEVWVRWHERGRTSRRLRRWRDAVEGMVDELSRRGYRRTYQAVDARLKVARRRMRGMDR
jgi:hypothetical protein